MLLFVFITLLAFWTKYTLISSMFKKQGSIFRGGLIPFLQSPSVTHDGLRLYQALHKSLTF